VLQAAVERRWVVETSADAGDEAMRMVVRVFVLLVVVVMYGGGGLYE